MSTFDVKNVTHGSIITTPPQQRQYATTQSEQFEPDCDADKEIATRQTSIAED
jgi:hypothetical protein